MDELDVLQGHEAPMPSELNQEGGGGGEKKEPILFIFLLFPFLIKTS